MPDDTEGATTVALSLIKTLAAQGHAYSYIAEALNRQAVPSAKGGRWNKGTVFKLAKKHGIRVGYCAAHTLQTL